MYHSYSVSNMPEPIVSPPPKAAHIKSEKKEPTPKPEKKETLPFFSGLKSDDLLLLLVIAVLIFNECDDKLLLLALVYIFFSDYFK